MRFRSTIAGCAFATVAALSAAAETPKSMMFTDGEVLDIERALGRVPPAVVPGEGDKAAVAQAPPPRQPNIYVSAILGSGGGGWTVWVNGRRVTPTRQQAGFEVTDVVGDMAEIVVRRAGAVEHLKLRANQTWRARERDIVEGIYP